MDKPFNLNVNFFFSVDANLTLTQFTGHINYDQDFNYEATVTMKVLNFVRSVQISTNNCNDFNVVVVFPRQIL